MILNSESVSKMSRFLDRCLLLTGYTICFYVDDAETSKYLYEFISNYYKGVGKETEINDNYNEFSNQILFKNKSFIQIYNRDTMVSHIRSNVAFIDSRLRENYIRESVFPILCEYKVSETDAMINPKPIYIKFLEENNEEWSEAQARC